MSDTLFTEHVDAASESVVIDYPDARRTPRRRGVERRTSIDARRRAQAALSEHHLQVLTVAARLADFTHSELVRKVNHLRDIRSLGPLQPTTVRTVCRALEKHGLIEATKKTRPALREDGRKGNKSTVWHLTATGRHEFKKQVKSGEGAA